MRLAIGVQRRDDSGLCLALLIIGPVGAGKSMFALQLARDRRVDRVQARAGGGRLEAAAGHRRHLLEGCNGRAVAADRKDAEALTLSWKYVVFVAAS